MAGMKFIITGFLVIIGLIGYAIYFLHNSQQIPQHLTPEYWKNVTPNQLIEQLKSIKNVNEFRLDNKRTMLHLLAIYGQYPEMVGFLIDAGVDYRLTDDDGDGDRVVALHYAIVRKDNPLEFVQEMLKYVKDVNEPYFADEGAVSPLIGAVCCSKMPVKISQLLLEKKANPNFVIQGGYTPIMIATAGTMEEGGSYQINPQLIQLLLDYGADIRVENTEGKSAYDYMKENLEFTRTEVFKKISSQFQ